MNTPERAMVAALVNNFRTECFTSPAMATEEQAFGLLMSRYFHFSPLDILRAAQFAAEDANAHAEAGVISGLADALERADDDALIDGDTRSALFASLSEVYPGIGKDRNRRLAKLNLLANRPADNPITSLSDRYCDMTQGDARRVFDMLNEMREARV